MPAEPEPSDPHDVLPVKAFRSAADVEDWRVLGDGAHVRYRCASLQEAARFAAAVVDRTATRQPPPGIDLRAASVTIHLPELAGSYLEVADLALARTVQATAREQGLVPDPSSLRSFQLAVARAPGVEVQAFWEAILGYVPISEWDSRDPHEHGPRVWFHDLENGRTGRGRTHFDVYVPAEEAERIVAAALAAGGRVADDSNAPEWWTLASPDNHGVDVAPWPDQG
jgi:4a-hydroxytetrahydrobiopterin dehydratase